MQSAYVQAMPYVGHMETQADGHYGPQGHPDFPVRASGVAAGTQAGWHGQYDSVGDSVLFADSV